MSLTLHYDFASDKSLAARKGPTLSITRATNGTYRDSNGTIQTAGSGVARFDHDASGNSLGLLVEEARTNLALYNTDTSNAAWVASNVTKGSTSVTVPDGASSTTVRLTASAGNGTLLQSVTSASATRAYSVYMKRVTGTGNIDLTVDGGSTWTTKTLTSEWQRFDITQAAVTNPQFGVRIVTSGDAIDFWGSQLETGAFPTSLIYPTTTASVTRNQDVVRTTDTTWYNNGAGTFYFKGQLVSPTNSIQALYRVDGSTLAWGPRTRTAGQLEDNYFGSGADGALTDADPSPNTEFQFVSAVAADDLTAYLDGTLHGTPDTTLDIDATGANTGFGVGATYAGATQIDAGHIAEIRYYNTRLSNAQLEAMSNGVFPAESQGGMGLGFGKMGFLR